MESDISEETVSMLNLFTKEQLLTNLYKAKFNTNSVTLDQFLDGINQNSIQVDVDDITDVAKL